LPSPLEAEPEVELRGTLEKNKHATRKKMQASTAQYTTMHMMKSLVELHNP
jgi:hypothetical protein